MPQLNYNLNPGAGYPGMVAEGREANVIISKLAHLAVPVGLLCAPGPDDEVGPALNAASAQSTNPGQVIALPTGLVANPMVDSSWTGVPIYDSSRPPYDSTNSYSDHDYVPVLIKGVIWVAVDSGTPVSQGPVYVRTAASGGLTTLGKFAAAPGTGLVAFPRGTWMTGLVQGNLAILQIW